jgi:hypothetical protein
MFTTTVPPFSTKRFRALRLVMHRAESAWNSFVRYPSVKAVKTSSVSPNATLTSP